MAWPAPHGDTRPRSAAYWKSAWPLPRRLRQTLFSTRAGETAVLRAERSPNPKSQTPCRAKPRTDAGVGSNGPIFLFPELFLKKPFQVHAADGRSATLHASPHLDLSAHPLPPLRPNSKRLRL